MCFIREVSSFQREKCIYLYTCNFAFFPPVAKIAKKKKVLQTNVMYMEHTCTKQHQVFLRNNMSSIYVHVYIALCNTAIIITNIEGGKILHIHTQQ